MDKKVEIYNKLVRDKVPGVLALKGLDYKARILEKDEYADELDEKLLEETKEYLDSGEIEELADIQEVIFAILKVKGVSRGDFDKIRKDKLNTRGGFEERIFLETVTSAK
jgi:predicted house-cleaning noncanonical NTP pyrophosphatase (MazG superfamily)